jgi:hypothetical protein
LKEQAMLNILTEALLLAAGQRPASTAQRRNRDANWSERFPSRQTRDLDQSVQGLNTKRDLNW